MARLFLFLKIFLQNIPGRVQQWIFDFAFWGKRQVDKRINTNQREHLHTIIFKSDTPEGRRFDTIIIWTIVFSIVVVMLETVASFKKAYWWTFFLLEWGFTLIFTVEYVLRLYCTRQPLR